MLEEEGSTPTAQGRMGLKFLWPPANLQETSFPPSAKAGLPQRHRKVSGCSEGTPRGHGDGDVLGLLVQGECPLRGAAGAWFGPPGQNLGLWGSNSAEGTLVGKPRGLSCHTPHLGFWHPAFLRLLVETPGGGEGGAPALGSSVGFVCQVSAGIPLTVRGVFGVLLPPQHCRWSPGCGCPAGVTPTGRQHGLGVPRGGTNLLGWPRGAPSPRGPHGWERCGSCSLVVGCRVGGV